MTRRELGASVAILDHAVRRYIERVRPGSEPARAHAELVQLLGVAEFVFEPPEWLARRARQTAPVYAVIADVVTAAAGRARSRLTRCRDVPHAGHAERGSARTSQRRTASTACSPRERTNQSTDHGDPIPMNPTSSTETTHNAAAVRHEDLVAAIDARLAAVDQQLAAFDVLRQERDRLFRARRALVGGDRGGGEARLSATTVLAMLAGYPGSTTGELAALLGSGDSAVRAHLHRARLAGRCTARERRWYVTERAAGDGDDHRPEPAPDVVSATARSSTAVPTVERDAVEGSAR